MRKRLFRWIKIFILVYCGIGLILFFFQDKFLFHPVALKPTDAFKFTDKHEEFFIRVNETDSISLVKFIAAGPIYKGAVIYYHGNRENINHYAVFSKNFTKEGYDVWMMDYPGFGKSTGEMTEKKLLTYALQVYKFVAARHKPDSIIIYGKSLGTGIATYVAASGPCKRLILETPYHSVPEMATHYFFIYPFERMSKYKIPTYKYLEDVKAPATIFHGTADWTIPYSHAQRLATEYKMNIELITIKDGEHNNLNDFPLYHQKLDSILRLP